MPIHQEIDYPSGHIQPDRSIILLIVGPGTQAEQLKAVGTLDEVDSGNVQPHHAGGREREFL
jgi:hypothetical protein